MTLASASNVTSQLFWDGWKSKCPIGMGLVAISLKSFQRIEVLTKVLTGRRTVRSAATLLALSERQVNRLMVHTAIVAAVR